MEKWIPWRIMLTRGTRTKDVNQGLFGSRDLPTSYFAPNFNFLWFLIGACPWHLIVWLPSVMIKNFILHPMYKPRVGISRGTIYRDWRWLKGKKLLSHSQMDAHSGSRLVDLLYVPGEIRSTRMQCGTMVGWHASQCWCSRYIGPVWLF